MIRLLHALALAAFAQAALGADPEPAHLNDPALWGTLVTVVRPEYPREAVARRQSGVVEVDGIVQGTGFLKDIRYRPDKPESSVFVDALRDLVPDWRFHAPLGSDCLPTGEAVTTRVSFEMDGDTPRIFVTHSPKAPKPAMAGEDFKPISRPNPRYPSVALRRGHEARVYVKIDIDASGKVVNGHAKAYSEQARRNDELRPFTDGTLYFLSQWQFPPVADGRSRAACYDVTYNITN